MYQSYGTNQVTIPSNLIIRNNMLLDNSIGVLVCLKVIFMQYGICIGRECRITCRKLRDSSFLFHIPHENIHKWESARRLECWWLSPLCGPLESYKLFQNFEISTLPVWVNLKKIPDSCFSRLGINHITSGLGEPKITLLESKSVISRSTVKIAINKLSSLRKI